MERSAECSTPSAQAAAAVRLLPGLSPLPPSARRPNEVLRTAASALFAERRRESSSWVSLPRRSRCCACCCCPVTCCSLGCSCCCALGCGAVVRAPRARARPAAEGNGAAAGRADAGVTRLPGRRPPSSSLSDARVLLLAAAAVPAAAPVAPGSFFDGPPVAAAVALGVAGPPVRPAGAAGAAATTVPRCLPVGPLTDLGTAPGRTSALLLVPEANCCSKNSFALHCRCGTALDPAPDLCCLCLAASASDRLGPAPELAASASLSLSSVPCTV